MTAKKAQKARKKTTKRVATKVPAPVEGGAVQRSELSGSWNPFATMRRLSDEMEQLFRGVGVGDIPSLRWLRTSASTGLWGPDVDILERKGQVIIRADLPGLGKEDVTVDVTDSDLTIKGERKSETEETKGGYYRSERSYGSFRRTVRLPEGVKTDQAKASFKNGVLEITMPTTAKKAGRWVAVNE